MTTFIPSLTLPSSMFANPYISIATPVVLGTAVGYACRPKKTQKTYMALEQPPFRPPPWVFGPAWTLLYGLMGYSAYRAYTTGLTPFRSPLDIQATKAGFTLYTVQLGLNLAWMPLFFAFKQPIAATVDILALTGTVGYLAYTWGKVDAIAGWTLAPYLGWLCFATYLTIGVGHLNGWSIADKEVDIPPSVKDTKYVDEKYSKDR